MDKESKPSAPDLLAQIKDRLLEEAKEKIARELADFERLALAYPDAVKAFASQLGLAEPSTQPPSPPETKPSAFESIGDLIDGYLTAPNSPVHGLKPATRTHYTTLLNLIRRDYADQKVAEMDASTLDAWYAKWKDGDKFAASYSKMVMLRNLFSFAITTARDENCARLYGLLGKMRIEVPKARREHLTRNDANLIRAQAHKQGRPSIALAQAFQSDTGLLQKDVIGEWLPLNESGMSVILSKGMKWLRGIQWDEIDENLILRHATGGKERVVDLKKAPMVMEELSLERARHGGQLPKKGPVIVSEYDQLPWEAVEFRRWWRKLANECGIDPKVRNSDSRVKASAEAKEGAANESLGQIYLE